MTQRYAAGTKLIRTMPDHKQAHDNSSQVNNQNNRSLPTMASQPAVPVTIMGIDRSNPPGTKRRAYLRAAQLNPCRFDGSAVEVAKRRSCGESESSKLSSPFSAVLWPDFLPLEARSAHAERSRA